MNSFALANRDMKVVLITTKLNNHPINIEDESNVLKEVNKHQRSFARTIEVEEYVAKDGNVIVDLQENAINGILREIYNAKPEVVIIALNNANRNPVHEKIFENLLYVAGIKSVYVSYKSDDLISFLYTL